ncbi:MAG: lytic transglycosylase domain-containing protein [Rhodanobacter sp.]
MPVMTPPAPPTQAAVIQREQVSRTQRLLSERCIQGAAQHYQVRTDVLRAVMHQEAGTVGQVRWNTDGSYDMGPMQINSKNLSMLAPYGINAQNLTNNVCLNIYIGAWFLKSGILKRGDLWQGIGDYHSHTPSKNVAYQWRVYAQLQHLGQQGEP